MAIRLKTKWSDKDRKRSPKEQAGALAFTVWRIGMEGVLNLENEGFQTESQSQRMDITAEFMAFLIHLTDRNAYDPLTDEERHVFISALALRLADFMQDNRQDVEGPRDYRGPFINLINERMSDYAECSYSAEEGPGFSMRRTFGDHVTRKMGDKDRKWITEWVMEMETPEALATLKRAMKSLLGWES
jgi:hypothetical protein